MPGRHRHRTWLQRTPDPDVSQSLCAQRLNDQCVVMLEQDCFYKGLTTEQRRSAAGEPLADALESSGSAGRMHVPSMVHISI